MKMFCAMLGYFEINKIWSHIVYEEDKKKSAITTSILNEAMDLRGKKEQ